ncbi:acyltransferase family protein [Agrococcus sp. ProA11]|uniref:acyltransferase family protein n=1 Tax=Agrococcus chionoecetis TaxID=3153752 RepID=UPI003260CA76
MARHAWPDVARGITVLLVVAMHILFLHSMPLLPDTLAVRGHLPLTSAMTHLRMPLFFLVSGYLSAAMVQRSWRAGFSGRIAPRYYLYVVWLTITALALRTFAVIDQAPFDTSDYVISQLLEPRGTLWYIWALALFFLVVRATRAIPAWMLAIPAAILFIVGQIAFDQPWRDISAGFLPFLLGARLPKEIRALTDRVPLRIGVPVLGAGIALALIDSSLRWPLPVGLAVAAVAVPGVLMVLPHIAQWRILRPIRHVGRNTLAIFAIHPLLIVLANRIARDQPMLMEVIGAQPVLALLWPLALLVGIVLVALALQRLLRAIGLRHLFEMPRWRALRRAFRLRRATRRARRAQ